MDSVTPPIDTLLSAAWTALQRNDLGDAEARFRAALSLEPDNATALGGLGYLLHSTACYPAAEEVFCRLVELHPQDPDQWMNLGTARRCAGRLDEALQAFSHAAALGANSAGFLFNVGLTHIDRRDFEAGRAVLAQASTLAPDDAEIRVQYALSCYESVHTDEALAALEHWDNLSNLNNELVAEIGLLLTKLGAVERAELPVRQAVAGAGMDPRPLLNLAQLLERTNRLDEAERTLLALAHHPQVGPVQSEVALLNAHLAQRRGDHATAQGLFASLLALNNQLESEHLLQFPLAKSLDALGRHDEAFDALQGAHRSQSALLKITSPALLVRGAPTLVITRFGCDAADVAGWTDPWAPLLEESPIFIVAFPRSGTTLLELTLDAHPALVSMDEQPFVQNALDDMVAAGAAYPERLGSLTGDELAGVRDRYWQRARTKATLRPGQRLVDKNPLNILRLPAIKRLFPNAPIVLAVRHPCDVILSCFMQHFRTPDFALLCGDLPTLALGYRRAFDFWYAQKELLAPVSMELRYETFTADFGAQIRSVLEFLALPWDDAVMHPQANARDKAYISTPSYSQVIEPVHRKAVGRWHSYEAQFAAVLPIIQPYLERWNYEGLGSSNSR